MELLRIFAMFLVMFFHIRPFMTDNLPHVIFDLLGFIGCAEIIYIYSGGCLIGR